jgi:hypothetical protein
VNRTALRLISGLTLAVAVPVLALDLAAGAERQAAGLSAAPFAWRNVLIAHLIAVLPLSLTTATWLRSRPVIAGTGRTLWLILAAVMTALGAFVVSPALAASLAASQIDSTLLLLLRCFLAFALVLPWCVAAADPPSRPMAHPMLSFGGALGLAIVPCWIYVDVVTASRAGEAATLLQQQRLAKAEPLVIGLGELGSDRRLGAMTAFEARRWLTAELPALNRQLNQQLPATPTPKARMDRAVLLVKLERLDEAAELLRPLVPGDDAATAMLAAINRDQGRFAESDALSEGLLSKRLPEARRSGPARALCESAFAGLAESARAEHRFADAEAVLTRGLRELPGDSAQLHFLLGRTYRDMGRFDPAIEHLQTAARLEPARYGQPAHDMIQQLRTSTLGCFTHARRRSLADRP